MNACAFSFVLVLLCVSCGSPQRGGRAAAEDDIREAVFLHQFRYFAPNSEVGENACAYYLAVEHASDPSNELLRRFVGHTPPVQKASHCKWDTGGVFDKETKRQGLLFRIDSLRWLTVTKVEVTAYFHEWGRNSWGATYSVRVRGGKWQIIKVVDAWSS